MESNRHRTYKKVTSDETKNEIVEPEDTFKTLLEDSAKEAYSRPWHRLERGLRLNRLRIFIEDVSPQFLMTAEDKTALFVFLQKALDKKLLNTLKVVNYDTDTQRIVAIKGLEITRNDAGILKWSLNAKKLKPDATRKKKKEELPSVSTILPSSSASTAE
jgi:hypothetical protein